LAPKPDGNAHSSRNALNATAPSDSILLQGWVRTRRDAKAFSFIELNDGSCLKGMQVIVDATLPDYPAVSRAIPVRRSRFTAAGESKGQGQKWEVVAEKFTVLGEADATYPLQKKGHSMEFLREIAHLRRARISSAPSSGSAAGSPTPSTSFSRAARFIYVHTPIITASDCEGAGELFA